VTPSSPTTSGKAPPRVATSGTPHAIDSTAGSENPSYSDGTTATSAWAYNSIILSLLIPDSKVTASETPRRSMALATGLSPRSLPTTTR